MGIYINPEHESIEDWLHNNSSMLLEPPQSSFYKDALADKNLFVCLVDNGHFTAAAVAFSENELKDFLRPDGRLKNWFLVSIENVLTTNPEIKEYLKDAS